MSGAVLGLGIALLLAGTALRDIDALYPRALDGDWLAAAAVGIVLRWAGLVLALMGAGGVVLL